MSRIALKPSTMNTARYSQIFVLLIPVLLLTAACGHKQPMSKPLAERSLKVFDSELIGKAFGIMQTEGWNVFSDLLKSDSNPADIPQPKRIFPGIFLDIPLDFNREYYKHGTKVCAVNYYSKTNPDSSFYIRKVIFIKPWSLEMQCFYTTDILHHRGRITLAIYGRDTAGNFLEGRIRGRVSIENKGVIRAEFLHADMKFFNLVFSADAGFNPSNGGSHEIWSDAIRNCTIQVSDLASGQYIGRFELAEKKKAKNRDFLFVFPDGSGKPASACFSWYSILKSRD